MFVVIYRGFVKPGLEQEYLLSWKIIAEYFIKHCGSLGSSLHRAEDGMYLAYSRWPDKETRDKSWGESVNVNFPESIQNAIFNLKNALDQSQVFPEIQLTLLDEVSTKS